MSVRGGLLVLLSQLTACYAMDSATSACQRNPAYCVSAVGEETVVPTVRGGAEVASLAGVYRLLTPDTRARIEQELVECAESADAEVNRLRFGGDKPTRQQCQELMPELDPCGKKDSDPLRLQISLPLPQRARVEDVHGRTRSGLLTRQTIR